MLFPDFGDQKHKPQDNQIWVVIRQDGELLGRIAGYYPDSFEVINVSLTEENDKLLKRTASFPFNETARHSSCFFGYSGGSKSERSADNSHNFALEALLWVGVLIVRTLLFVAVLVMQLLQSLFGPTKKSQKENIVSVESDQEVGFENDSPTSMLSVYA